MRLSLKLHSNTLKERSGYCAVKTRKSRTVGSGLFNRETEAGKEAAGPGDGSLAVLWWKGKGEEAVRVNGV